MAYVALYREWRPKTFNDLVGQRHVSQTLKNALATGRIAHAYLFCGPRGTGKTSSAKVLAKAVNCQEGLTPEPCNICKNCTSINQGTSMDVLEIDAASNRGIDEIRDLREKVKLAATEGRYKVYIIDEVHMLTTEAFNALLKTLEEPPEHIIFILATTEPHKIPPTILSRCQRFDFRRIGFEDMVERLQFIAVKEGLSITREALSLIVKGAEGGMRDALSTLDQCISYGGKEITEQNVMAVLGTVGTEALHTVALAISEKHLLPGLEVINGVFDQGKEVRQFLKDLVDYFRQMLLIQVCQNPREIVQVNDTTLEQLKELSQVFSRSKLIQIITNLTEAEREMKWSTQPRLLLELALIKSLQDDYKGSIDNLIERITLLEDKLNEISKMGIRADQGEGKKAPEPLAWQDFCQEAQSGEKPFENPGEKLIASSEVVQDYQAPFESIIERWKDFLDYFKAKKKVALYAVLIEGEPVKTDGKHLTIAFNYAFHKDRVETPENKKAVEDAIKAFFSTNLRLTTILKEEKAKGKEENPTEVNTLVKEAINLFGGDIIEIND